MSGSFFNITIITYSAVIFLRVGVIGFRSNLFRIHQISCFLRHQTFKTFQGKMGQHSSSPVAKDLLQTIAILIFCFSLMAKPTNGFVGLTEWFF
jgi:hypothetical protein